MAMAGIKVAGLGKTFLLNSREVTAISNMDMLVHPGAFFAVAGRSGSGKTTLLRLLAGLEEPSSGCVSFFRDGSEVPRKTVRVGFVFQEPRLMPWLSVEENLAFALKETLPPERIRKDVERILEMVGLTDFRDAYPRQISGGMAQRTALGRTLAYNPDVVLLDEPFGSLDYFTRRSLWQEIGNLHQKTGRTFLLVTHDVEEALALGDSVLVLRDSRIGGQVNIPFSRPRDPSNSAFAPLRRSILSIIGEDSL